jgi:hypothetical protein
LVNTVLKKNFQKPNHDVFRMLRVVASEVLFRMSIMFLKTNEPIFLEKMTNVSPSDTVNAHRSQVQFLLKYLYPVSNSKGHVFTHSEAFEKCELILGHDLFVKSIMAMSKTGKNKSEFAKGIPEVQWDEFVKNEEYKHRSPPSVNSYFMATPYKHSETTKASKMVSMTSKKSKSVKKKDFKTSKDQTTSKGKRIHVQTKTSKSKELYQKYDISN